MTDVTRLTPALADRYGTLLDSGESHGFLWYVLPYIRGERFTDPNRPSCRRDFATDGKRFFFAIEDRQSEVFVAELIR